MKVHGGKRSRRRCTPGSTGSRPRAASSPTGGSSRPLVASLLRHAPLLDVVLPQRLRLVLLERRQRLLLADQLSAGVSPDPRCPPASHRSCPRGEDVPTATGDELPNVPANNKANGNKANGNGQRQQAHQRDRGEVIAPVADRPRRTHGAGPRFAWDQGSRTPPARSRTASWRCPGTRPRAASRGTAGGRNRGTPPSATAASPSRRGTSPVPRCTRSPSLIRFTARSSTPSFSIAANALASPMRIAGQVGPDVLVLVHHLGGVHQPRVAEVGEDELRLGVIDRHLVDLQRVGVLHLRGSRVGVAAVEDDRDLVLRGQFEVAAGSRGCTARSADSRGTP